MRRRTPNQCRFSGRGGPNRLFAGAVAIVVGLALASCGDGTPDDGGAPDLATIGSRCVWDAEPFGITETQADEAMAEVPTRFTRVGSAPVYLLVERQELAPGESVSVAVANDSDSTIGYGTSRTLRRDGQVAARYPAPGVEIAAASEDVGRCIRFDIPAELEPGTYRAVLEDVETVENELGFVIEITEP